MSPHTERMGDGWPELTMRKGPSTNASNWGKQKERKKTNAE